VPIVAILVQAAIALLLIVLVGTAHGRNGIDQGLQKVGLAGLPWDQYFGGFETLVAATAPVFWTFFLLTGISVFVLRLKDGGTKRPFAVPWFPLTPLIFCLTCGYMLCSSLVYAKLLALLGIVPILIGAAVYAVDGQRRADAAGSSSP
jgi:amino acid transporter